MDTDIEITDMVTITEDQNTIIATLTERRVCGIVTNMNMVDLKMDIMVNSGFIPLLIPVPYRGEFTLTSNYYGIERLVELNQLH